MRRWRGRRQVCEAPGVQWVGWGVGAVVLLTATEILVRYARRNGHGRPRLSRGFIGFTATIAGAGSALVFINPGAGLTLLMLAIPLTALALFWYRKVPSPTCAGALVLLRDARLPHAPRYRCSSCGRGFHTAEGVLVANSPVGT